MISLIRQIRNQTNYPLCYPWTIAPFSSCKAMRQGVYHWLLSSRAVQQLWLSAGPLRQDSTFPVSPALQDSGMPWSPPRVSRTWPCHNKALVAKHSLGSSWVGWWWILIPCRSIIQSRCPRCHPGVWVPYPPVHTRGDASSGTERNLSQLTSSGYSWFPVSLIPGFPPHSFVHFHTLLSARKLFSTITCHSMDSCQNSCTLGRILAQKEKQPEGRIWVFPVAAMA